MKKEIEKKELNSEKRLDDLQKTKDKKIMEEQVKQKEKEKKMNDNLKKLKENREKSCIRIFEKYDKIEKNVLLKSMEKNVLVG